MIIGKNFAFGHVPRTGGDAVLSWSIALGLREMGIYVTAPNGNVKHDWFLPRAKNKDFYLIGFRKLPDIVASLLYARDFYCGDIHGYGDSSSIENALCRPWMDEWLIPMCQGIPVIHVMKIESLFHDLKWFLSDVIGLIDRDSPIWENVHHNTETKGIVSRDVSAFWQGREAEVYALNPKWAEMEKCVYGGESCPSFFDKVIMRERVAER